MKQRFVVKDSPAATRPARVVEVLSPSVRRAAWNGVPTAATRAASRLLCEGLEGRQLMSVSQDAGGWTVVTPSADTRTIYVSSAGSDRNAGTSTSSSLATIAAAMKLVRTGFPDQILLRRGDTFFQPITNWNLSGRSAAEPFVLGAYTDPAVPSSERPMIASGISTGFSPVNNANSPVSHVYIMGVAFEANQRNYRNPPANFTTTWKVDAQGGTYGINVVGPMSDLLVEDCSFEYYRTNISLQAGVGAVSDVRVRRSSLTDAYIPNVDPNGIVLGPESNITSEGIYSNGVAGLTIDGNVLDHNGWIDSNALGAIASIYHHNLYLNIGNSNVVVTNNYIADAGSHGLQMRCGGIVTNNVFARNPIGMSFGLVNGTGKVGGVFGEISGNVFLEDRDISGSARGWSIEMANLRPISAGGGTVVRNNIFAADSQRAAATIKLDTPSANNEADQVGINDLTIESNIIYSWQRALYINPQYVTGSTGFHGLNRLTVRNNDIQAQYGGGLIDHWPAFVSSTETFSNNRYDSAAPETSSQKWFKVQGTGVGAAAWKSTYEPTAAFGVAPYPDPTRGLGTYNGTVGGGTTTDAFLAQARRQSKAFWRPAYTTSAVIDYVRSGFTGGKIDTAAPTASAAAPNLTVAGPTTQTVTVTYSDDNKLDLSSLGDGDVRVVGPNGYSAPATFVSMTGPADGSKRVVTYSVAAPGGQGWTAAANGLYSVVVQSSQVLDATGKATPTDTIGSFSVAIDPSVPSAVATAPTVVTDTAPAVVTVTYTGATSPALPTSVSPANAGFETPNVGSDAFDAFQYGPVGGGWDFSSSAGLTGNNSGFSSGNPVAPQGAQVAFIQLAGSISQAVPGWAAGTYTVSLSAAQRGNVPSAADLQILIDGQAIATFNPGGTTYQNYSTPTFTVGAGTHTVTLVGLNSAGGDNTVFIDDVQILGVTTPVSQQIAATSLDPADVSLAAPGGTPVASTGASADSAVDGNVRVVTYTFPAPTGGWTSLAAGGGTYAVNTVAGQVATSNGAALPAGRIGAVKVAINAPTATVTAANITAASSAAQTFTVRYLDDAAGIAGSIDSADLTVTGPNGFNSPVTLLGFTGDGTAAAPLVATYSVSGPAQGWTTAANGTYWVTAQPGQVIDADGNALAAGAIGSFKVAIDASAPLAWVSIPNITNPTGLSGTPAALTFGVSYYDVNGINVGTIDSADVRVTGPNGYDQAVTKVSAAGGTNNAAYATYSLTPPAGGWKSSYNGTYSFVLQPNQVFDNAGNAAAAAKAIGTFAVALETVVPTVTASAVSPNPRNSAVTSVGYTFSETVTGFDPADLSLTRDGAPVPLAGASITTSNNISYTLTLPAALTSAGGTYALSANAAGSGVADLAGNLLASGATTTWTVDVTPPSATATAPTISAPTASGQLVTVAYADNFSLNAATIDLADIVVTGPNGYFASPTAVSVTGSGATRSAVYTVPAPAGGWSSSANGSYVVTLQPSQVADAVGNTAAGGTIGTFSVALETTPPTVALQPVTPSPRSVPVDSVPVTFSEGVSGFDLADVTLTRDGVPVSLAGARITTLTSTTYAIEGLSSATTPVGNYVLSVVAAGSGIKDAAGNSLADGASTTFSVVAAPAGLADAGFESPAVGGGFYDAYASSPAGTPWVFSSSSGVTGNGSGYSIGAADAPEGDQAAFLHFNGSISQTINGTAAGNYVLSFRAAQRVNFQSSYQVIDVRVDGASVGTFQPEGDGQYGFFATPTFALAAGSHTIAFVGLNPNGGDNTAFIDDVRLEGRVSAVISPVREPRSTPVDSLTITFTRPVAGFDLADLSLTRDSLATSLAGATLSSVDDTTFTLSGLTSATTPAGDYVLRLTAAGSGIVDSADNVLAADATMSWRNDNLPSPTVTSVTPSPVVGSQFLQDVTIHGSGFTADSFVTLQGPGGTVISRPTIVSRSATQLVARVALPTAGTWAASVSLPTTTSSNAMFTVSAPAAIKATATTTSGSKTVSLVAQNAVGAALAYTWSTTSAPAGAGPVTFAGNGTAAAVGTVATLAKAGTYTFAVKVSDGVTSFTTTVSVTVAQVLKTLTVSPAAPTVALGKTQQFTAAALDQFGLAMTTTPTKTWSKVSGLGTVSTAGLFTAPATGAGTAVVKVTSGAITGTATVTIPFAALKVDFVPAAAAVASGYQRDGGLAYADRGNGYSYGWSVSHTDAVIDRNKNSTQLLDTSIGVKAGAKWELAVANGKYTVKIGVGDATVATTNTVLIEGTSVYAATKQAANVFSTKTVTVTVTDGKLTLSVGSAANLATRLTHIEITKA